MVLMINFFCKVFVTRVKNLARPFSYGFLCSIWALGLRAIFRPPLLFFLFFMTAGFASLLLIERFECCMECEMPVLWYLVC